MAEEQSLSVSVIIRTLGNSDRIGDALESLARQSRNDFEVVILDMSAGSVEPLLGRFSSRLNLHHLKVGRPLTRPVALNIGVIEASAPMIAILDEDDLYDPAYLELMIAGLESSRADYVYCGVRHATYAPDGHRVACREVAVPYSFEELTLRNYIDATGSLYRKELWERVGGYDERFEVYGDWEFNIRAAKAGKLVHLPTISNESREYLGLDGVALDLDSEKARRCVAGVYWKHRRLYRGRRFFRLGHAWAEHYRRWHPAGTGWRTWSIAGWRPQMASDLMAWWRFERAWAKGKFALTPRQSASQR
jgi:glycosyltransferase involved in cell wall biosynthesis